MGTYDFHRIFEPMEFQDFVRDVIQVREGILFESFADGRDLGIDNRCIANDGTCTILQAKRWKDTGKISFSALRKEKEKLDRLEKKPDRYILVTTQNMTPPQKAGVMEVFRPYIINESDIVTEKDLNNYLSSPDGSYKSVVEKYFKLWIQSTDVLKKVLQETVHSALTEESKIEFKRIIQSSGSFVETGTFRKAVKQLAESRIIIISGEPGMGKTTLAGQLGLYYYLKEGYTTFLWISDVDDLYTSCQMDGKRIIIFDDFWGSSFFDRRKAGREEDRLARFMDEVRGGSDCILILTTRAYILEQGLKQHEDLRTLIEKHKLECRLHEYSGAEKAKIYFSHLSRAKLKREQLRGLFDMHAKVIGSENYNPRVIEVYLKSVKPEDEPGQCQTNFLEYLRNPVDFWKKIFTSLSIEARFLYMCLYLFPKNTDDVELKKCYVNALPLLGGAMSCRTFGEILAELEKTTVRTDPLGEDGSLRISFQNPSAREFIEGYLDENAGQYFEILSSACNTFESCLILLKIGCEEIQNPVQYSALMEKASKLLRSEDEYSWEEDFCQLLEFYKAEYCASLNEFARRGMNRICSLLTRHIIRLPGYLVTSFEHAAAAALDGGVLKDAYALIKIYMDSIMSLHIELRGYLFESDYPEAWKRYLEESKEEIRQYIVKYYTAEIYLAAAKQDSWDYDMSIEEYLMAAERFEIGEIPEVTAAIQESGDWIKEEAMPKKQQEDKKDQEYRHITEHYEEELFGDDDSWGYLDRDECIKYIKMYGLPLETEEKLVSIAENESSWIWNSLMKCEESMPFVIKYAEEKGEFHEDTAQAAHDICCYLKAKLGLLEGQLYNLPELSESLLSKAEEIGFVTIFEDDYDTSSPIFQILSDIAEISNLQEGEKDSYYRQMLMESDEVFNARELIPAMHAMDEMLFNKYIAELASNCLALYQGKNEEQRIMEFLNGLDICMDLDMNGNHVSAQCTCTRFTCIMESMEWYYVFDILPEYLEKPLLSKLQNDGTAALAGIDECVIRINDIKDKEILISMGVWQKTVRMWEGIKKLAKGVRYYGNTTEV